MRGILAGVLLLVSGLVAADASEAPQHVGSVTLDRSEQYLMPSSAVGDVFRVDVVLPMESDLPVISLLPFMKMITAISM